jgi:hypothetical protein
MKPINSLITKTKAQIGKASDVEVKQQSEGFINKIFHNLKLIFPAWRQNFKRPRDYDATKELWLNTLIDENITTPEQIDRAIKGAKLSASAFFPSIGQFIKWSEKEAPALGNAAHKLYMPKLRDSTVDYADSAEKGRAKIREELGI